ncbi:hypothetical protein [Streptomyces coerulescens]|uniref:Uncharacterized protein n=1 Tax=Streptomyces coerulescens TaxID=29304 RepID=A0ABW0CI14_STRCD
MSTTLKRAVGPALAAGLVVTALASPAAAQTPGSTAFRLFGTAFLNARAGVANQMTASVVGGRLIFEDMTGVAVGPGCRRLTATSADCGVATTVGGLAIQMGDGIDTYQGLVGMRTVVEGGPGADTVETGAGNDTIGVSGDMTVDTVVSCGGGSDVVFRDPGDLFLNPATCERRIP